MPRRTRPPLPVVNACMGRYEVDFHWPVHRLIVETDGRATHDTPHQFVWSRLVRSRIGTRRPARRAVPG